MSIRIYPSGEGNYIEDDRRKLIATGGLGNTLKPEVFLTSVDPVYGEEVALGWFTLDDLQRLIDTARKHYENGTPF
jgi:hypothetical protein